MRTGAGRLWWLAVPLLAVGGAWLALRGTDALESEGGAATRTSREAPGEAAPELSLQGASDPGLTSVARGNLAIRGKVLLASGRPAPGARVTASLKRGHPLARTTAGADGAYEVRGLAKDIYLLEGEYQEGEITYGADAVVSTSIQTFDLVLSERPRSLTFRVLDVAGEPVPRFDARLITRRMVQTLGTRGEGLVRLHVGVAFMLDGVSDYRGAYLEVWNARDVEDRGLYLAPRRIGPLEGTEKEVEVRLVPGPLLEGVVLAPTMPLASPVTLVLEVPKAADAGAPDPEAMLEEILPGAGKKDGRDPTRAPPFAGLAARVKTAPDGRFRMAFLEAAAEYGLSVQTDEAFLPVRPLAVRRGDPPLEIRLRVAVAARVTVVDPDGLPVPGATVYAQQTEPTTEEQVEHERARLEGDEWFDGGWAHELTDLKGEAVLARLDPARPYTLEVRPPDARRMAGPVSPNPAALRKFKAERWRPADTRVALVPGLHVRGHVLDAEGRPVKGARVSLQQDDSWSSDQADAEGAFLFEGLAPGQITLVAEPGGASRHGLFAWVQVPAPEAEGEPHASRVQVREGPSTLSADLQRSLDGVVLRVPVTLTVALRLPFEPPQASGKPKIADLFGSLVSGVSGARVLQKVEDGWSVVHYLNFAVEGPFTGKDAVCEVTGLDPGGTYAVWVPPADGKFVYQRLDPKAGSVTLVREVGGTLSGRVLGLPEGADGAEIRLLDDLGREIQGKAGRDGAFEVKGVPPGTWRVQACYTGAREALEAEASARTGSVVDLRLEPVKDDDFDHCGKACG